MKSKVLSRPLSRAEGFRFISDYFRSGMRAGEYYRSHDISEWQFYKWRKLYLLEHPELGTVSKAKAKPSPSSPSSSSEVPRFACLEVKEAPSPPPFSLPSIEIQYPNGICLRIGEGLKEISCLSDLVTLPICSSCSR